MRLWFVHSGEVSLQDQIVTQISLGILSRELSPGERLPSVRELARRFKLHPNTVSLAYQRLRRDGWVEVRRGSGVYVPLASAHVPRGAEGGDALDRQIAAVVEAASCLGISVPQLQGRIFAALEEKRKERWILIEPEPELAKILVAEIDAALGITVGVRELPLAPDSDLSDAMVLARPTQAAVVRAALPAGMQLQVLRVRAVSDSLAAFAPFPGTVLVGVVSSWPRFLDLARTMLIAAGLDADALLFRDARQPGAFAGLEQADAVICDAVTAGSVPEGVRSICFRLLAEEGLDELRHLACSGPRPSLA